MKAPVSKIAAEQSEFPQLVGDVLANISNRAVGTHDHLSRSSVRTRSVRSVVIAVVATVFSGVEMHHPAARILPRAGQVNRAALLQPLKCGVPELQVQDLALARQHIVFAR